MSLFNVSFQTCKKLATIALKAGVVPMIWGQPGIGKSSLAKELASDFNLELIDVRLAQREYIDILGFGRVKPNGRAEYCTFDDFPLEGDSLPAGKRGWLLNLDELSSADASTQKAAYQIILDRMLGNKKLHPNVAIMAMGNRMEDASFVEEMSAALKMRMQHFTMETSMQEWCEWATKEEIDYRIVAFVQDNPSMFSTFKGDNAATTYACARTYALLSKQLKITTDLPIGTLAPTIVGAIGQQAGVNFIDFAKWGVNLPKLSEILANPTTCVLPTNQAETYLLAVRLAYEITLDNVAKVLEYAYRWPSQELLIVMVRQAFQRTPELATKSKPFTTALIKTGMELMS